MKTILISSFAVVCFALAPQITQGADSPSSASHRDTRFTKDATEACLFEQSLGQLIQEKSEDANFKSLAQKIDQDYTAANQQLSTIAQQAGITAPTAPTSHEDRMVDHLQKKSEFDKAALHDMVKNQEKAVREFERESKHGENSGLQQFASETLPKLQADLDQCKTLYSQWKATAHEAAGASTSERER